MGHGQVSGHGEMADLIIEWKANSPQPEQPNCSGIAGELPGEKQR
jgi:hypothetical protein